MESPIRKKLIAWSLRRSPRITVRKLGTLFISAILIGFLVQFIFPLISYEYLFGVIFTCLTIFCPALTCHAFSYYEIHKAPFVIRIIALSNGLLAVYSSLFFFHLITISNQLVFDPIVLVQDLSNSYNFGLKFMDTFVTQPRPLSIQLIYGSILLGLLILSYMMSKYSPVARRGIPLQ